MSGNPGNSDSTPRKAILVISASQYLVGHPLSEVIKADWSKSKANGIADKFENVAFPVGPANVAATLESLQRTLQERAWDGVIVGWCIRGHVPEFTVLFEKIIAVLARQVSVQPELKIMFPLGPDDLVETTIRNFPV